MVGTIIYAGLTSFNRLYYMFWDMNLIKINSKKIVKYYKICTY